MSGAIARIVVGGCGPRGFFDYREGMTPVEHAGPRSLAEAATRGNVDALQRICEIVEAEKPRRSRPGTYFQFSSSVANAADEPDELVTGPLGRLTPAVERALRVALGIPVCRGASLACEAPANIVPGRTTTCFGGRWTSDCTSA